MFSNSNLNILIALGFGTFFGLLIFSSKLSLTAQNFSILIVEPIIKKQSDTQLVNEGIKFVQNVPPAPFILGNNIRSPRFKNKTCAPFPTIYKLEFSATIWQVQKEKDWTFYLFGAYWDARFSSIRVLTLVDRLHQHINKTYCQIWFENSSQPMITEVVQYTYIWFSDRTNVVNGELQPYLMNCDFPKNYSGIVPTSVSIVSSECQSASNNLRVYFVKPSEKEKVAVCAKGLSFYRKDWSVRLVEWIELLKIMGVSKVIIYDLENHPNVDKVLKYYSDSNYTEVLPLTHPSGIPNEPYLRELYLKTGITTKERARKRQQEMIPLNDCLYRNMYKYEYIAILDTDEIIIPHNGANNWIEFLEDLEGIYNNSGKSTQFFTFLDFIFSAFDNPEEIKEEENVPNYLYTLRHTERLSSPKPNNIGTKCIFRPEDIMIARHHHQTCINKCNNIFVNTTLGFLHHYSSSSQSVNPRNYVTDRQTWKWKDLLIRNSNEVLDALEFFS